MSGTGLHKRDTTGLVKTGRPAGVKNKTTIFKEVMKHGFEKKMEEDFARVLNTVVELAVGGDMKAAKLLFDRVLPKDQGISLGEGSGKAQINIVIGRLEDQTRDIEGEVVE